MLLSGSCPKSVLKKRPTSIRTSITWEMNYSKAKRGLLQQWGKNLCNRIFKRSLKYKPVEKLWQSPCTTAKPTAFLTEAAQYATYWGGCGSLARGWQQTVYRPSPRWGGEENGKKKAKLPGRDKGSLTEQRRKGTATIATILIRRIYKTSREMHRTALTSWCPACSPATIPFPHSQLPCSEPRMTAHGIQYSVFLTSLGQPPHCVPSWLLVKINPILTEPRTVVNLAVTSWSLFAS